MTNFLIFVYTLLGIIFFGLCVWLIVLDLRKAERDDLNDRP